MLCVDLLVTPGSHGDIFGHFQSHLQSDRDSQTEKDTIYEGSDSDVDDSYGGYEMTWTDTEVRDPQADEVAAGAGPSSNTNGGSEPSNEQQPKLSPPPSSGGSQEGVDHVPPKTAAVSDTGTGGSGKASGSTRPRRPGRGRRPVTKCRSVPVVYSGETVVRLGQICYQVPRDGDGS